MAYHTFYLKHIFLSVSFCMSQVGNTASIIKIEFHRIKKVLLLVKNFKVSMLLVVEWYTSMRLLQIPRAK